MVGLFFIMGDMLINCPCKSHKVKRWNNVGKEIKPVPKMLFIADENSVGEFKIQCPDAFCKKYNKEHSDGKYNSWYKIVLNGLGGCTVEPIPKQEFELHKIPIIVFGDQECGQEPQKNQQQQ